MQIDSATPPSGFAQNDSIAGGLENSNGNERRNQCFTCGANSTQLGLPVFVLKGERMKGVFSNISHHMECRVTWFALVAIIYPKIATQLLTPEKLFSSIPECHSAWRAFMPEVAESIADSNRFCDSAFGLRAEWQHCRRFRNFKWEWKKDSILYLWGKFYSIGFTFLCSSRRSGEWSVFGYFSSHGSPG